MAGDVRAGAERAVAVVLFTDLVGSTQLRSEVGEEAAEELRRRHDRLLTEAVDRHGGRVVKGLGDGVMATFAGASDAVAAGVAMQQAVERLNRSGKASVPLAVRVGLSAGDVSFEDGDVHGTPVVEAARLCGAAEGGEILASEMVRWLARATSAAVFIPVGEVELKGVPDRVPAVRIAWEPLASSSVPLPPLLTDVGPIFVGRDSEVERLGQLWKEAAAGERAVALLAGEPGVGKTRLAAELAGRVHAEGGIVLAGRCDEDLGVPYQPFVEALRFFVDHTSPLELAGKLGRYGGELTRLIPELAEVVPGLPSPLRSDPETERYRLFEAVAHWLASISSQAPALLILDDLQWAAKPTLLLLRHVLRFAEPTRLLVVGTYRDTDIGRAHPLTQFLADLRRAGGTVRFSLTGLDVSAVAAFLEKAAGHGLDDEGAELAGAVWTETQGNPFFVTEVLRHLSEAGALERRNERWVTTSALDVLGIPEGVREVVGRRLSRLSDTANRALTIAAVVGLEFELAVLGAGVDIDQDELAEALDEAIAARLLVDVPGATARLRFSHALVRATLYEELSGGRRAVLHRKVAEAIEAVHRDDLNEYLPALVHHWARGSAPGGEAHRAITYATQAGDQALAQLAHDEAVDYYQLALELLDATGTPIDDQRRLELLILLGEAQRRAGDPVHRETLLLAARQAERMGDVERLARAVIQNTRGHLMSIVGGVDEDKVAMLKSAVAAVGEDNVRARARLLATLALESTFAGDWRRCLALSDEALALARQLGDPETQAAVLLARFFPTYIPGRLDERLANTDELLRAVERIHDPALIAGANLLRGRALVEAGSVVLGDHYLEVADRISAGLGQPALRYRVLYILAGRAIAGGRLALAEQLILKSRELGHVAGQAETDWLFAWQMCGLRLEQGTLDEELVAQFEAATRGVNVSVRASTLALAACELGRDGDALAALNREAPESLHVDLYWLAATIDWATVTAHVGDTVRAERLAAALDPYASQPIAFIPVPRPSVAHHLALLAAALGRFDEAETRFAAAAHSHAGIGAPHWLARTQLEWARMLLTRRQTGDAERARELLGQALGAARRLGLAGVERGAVALLEEGH